jgi:transcriptional regulator with XRE-family HTH domain
MRTTLASMKLQEILEKHGIHTIRKLCEATGLKRQQAWMLWHGKAGVGKVMAKRLHERLNIPYEELLEVDPVPYTAPRKRSLGKTTEEGGRGGSTSHEDQ